MDNIHRTADVEFPKRIPDSTRVWQFCIILDKPEIGENSNIQAHCIIEGKAKIGNNVVIKPGNCIWDGITLEDNVMIASNVSFTNDQYPVARNSDYKMLETVIGSGTTVGAGAIILPGIIIGKNCLIGAGTLVTKDVPDNSIVRNKVQMVVTKR